MKLLLTLLSAITLTFSAPDNIGTARYPTIEGLVVLAPGTNDANACFVSDGYDGGGFYIQDRSGNGIWVCPQSNTLVNNINLGDFVVVNGLIQNNKVQILLIEAYTITKRSKSMAVSAKEVVKEADYNIFQNSLEYGDLISYEGYVELWWTEAVGAGFFITDCEGNTIKGWWTSQASVDVFDLFGFPKPTDVTTTNVNSYYEMVGFYEIYDPYCETWGGPEFQPR
eukprot:UN07429